MHIPFLLDQPSDTAQLTYRPWGTRTLKVKVTADVSTRPLRIRPQNINAKEAANGLFQGYANDNPNFIVSWGGGHENGPCLKAKDVLLAFEKCIPLEPDDFSMIYFNVAHIGPDVPDAAALTLEAYDEESGDVYASLPIQLTKPASYPANPARLVETETAVWQITGDTIAEYDPRFWPRPIAYRPLPAAPLTAKVSGNDLLVQWNGKTIATITDNSQPPIVGTEAMSFELFAFDEWNLALRVWFSWLDNKLGDGHEIPDAERFDLIIRQSDGRVTLACTDLHWREVWGEVVPNEPLRASIGLSAATKRKLIKDGAGKIWKMISGGKKEDDHNRIYNPVEGYISRHAAALGEDTTKRGKGAEAHVPSLDNVLQVDRLPSNMTSSDVRLG